MAEYVNTIFVERMLEATTDGLKTNIIKCTQKTISIVNTLKRDGE